MVPDRFTRPLKEIVEITLMTVHMKPRRFTVGEYAKMGDAGIFAPSERVELIEGEIVPMSPQNPSHAYSTQRLTTILVYAFGKTHGVRVQSPLTLNELSEPEPDFALVKLRPKFSGPRHPDHADLVLEVAQTSLPFDRREKSSLYAKAGILDYWILNLKKGRLEVRRDPIQDDQAPYGWDYASLRIWAPGETVSPLFSPEQSFEVAELVGSDEG